MTYLNFVRTRKGGDDSDSYWKHKRDGCIDSFGEVLIFSMLHATQGHWQVEIGDFWSLQNHIQLTSWIIRTPLHVIRTLQCTQDLPLYQGLHFITSLLAIGLGKYALNHHPFQNCWRTHRKWLLHIVLAAQSTHHVELEDMHVLHGKIHYLGHVIHPGRL